MTESIKVSSIHKRFKGNFINKSEISSNRTIHRPGFTRLGIELNGIFLNKEILSSVCWGSQESSFLERFDEEKQIQILQSILEKNPPLFLLSKNFRHTKLLEKLNKSLNQNQSALIQVDMTTIEIYSLVGSWIAKTLSKWTTIHGTVLNIWGEGVLIVGDPGVGKSEAASELIRMNHLFLADDAVNITRFGTTILARPNVFSKDFIHLRGLGILNIKAMYGGAKIIDETKISIVIQLKSWESIGTNKEEFENIGDEERYYNLLEMPIPLYVLPVTSGRNISELIELAVVDMKLKKQGYNSAKDMYKKYKKIISEKNQENL